MEPIIFSHKLATINDFSGSPPPAEPSDWTDLILPASAALLWINWRAKNAVKITPESKPEGRYIYKWDEVQSPCLVYLVWVARGISPEWSWNPSENVDDHVKCESDASNNYFQSTKDGTGTNLHRRSGRFEVLRTRIWTKAANKNTLWLVVWLMSKSIKRRVVRQYYNGRTEESPEQVVGG